MTRGTFDITSTERRLSNLTVETLRNYCDVHGIQGASGLLKKELVVMLASRADPASLEQFLSSCEADYLMESFRKAVKWGMSENLVRIGEGSDMTELHAEFNGLDVGLKRIYYIDFYNVNNPKSIRTGCECPDSSDKGLFCPHQMAVLLKAIGERKIRLDKWKGPMTAEVKGAIEALSLLRKPTSKPMKQAEARPKLLIKQSIPRRDDTRL
ncbi:MAG: hypothetical protein QXY98_00140 [Thermoplasmata archaeon]